MGASMRATVGVDFRATGVDAVRNGMKQVRNDAEQATKETTKVAREAEGLSGNAIFGISELSRGLSRVTMEGTASVMAMRELAGGIMRVGAGFGPVAGLVGIFTLLGGTIAEVFMKARKEISDTREKFVQEIGAMSNAGNASGLQQKLRDLQFGTPFTTTTDKHGKQTTTYNGPSGIVPGAFAGGILDLEARRDQIITELGNATNSVQADMLLKQRDAIDAQLKPLLEQAKQLSQALLNLASRPASTGMLPFKITAQGPKALAKDAKDAAKLIDDVMAMIAKEQRPGVSAIITPEMAGDLAANQAKQIFDLVKKYNPAVNDSLKGLGGLSGVHATAAKVDWNAVFSTDALESAKSVKELGDKIQTQFSDMIGKSISQGIQDGIKSHSLSAAFDGMAKGVLAGLGSIMIEVGEKALASMAFIKTISTSIAGMNWEVGVPAALGLIALGSVLESAGSSSSRSASVASGSFGGPGAYVGAPITVNPASLSMPNTKGLSPVTPVTLNATIIGKNDPQAQRELAEMLDLASRRGKTGYAL